SRFDFLVSQLALQRASDGEWIEAEGWHGFVSYGKGRTLLPLGGNLNERVSRIRFQIGVDPETNAADPNKHPADHALNPQVNGLHWGWQGGYVFMAIEGHHADGGFSYHLANDAHPMMVELPIALEGSREKTLRLQVDLAKILQGLSIVKDSDSTHSREKDSLAERLKQNVPQAFEVMGTSTDSYHPIAALDPVAPEHGTPLALRVTKRFPQVALPKDNPLTVEGVRLGERLFHDPRLSKGNAQSCASCHQQSHAFTDPNTRFSVGVNGDAGMRNAMPLFNLAWKKAFFWDGRVKSLREQVLEPIQDAHEMNEALPAVVAKLQADADYSALTEAAFGTRSITAEHVAKGLEQFLQTLISQDSKFDRAARREVAFTDEEKRGFQLFVTEFDPKNNLRGADCFHCHGGNLFTNHDFANNGLDATFADLGLGKVTDKPEDAGKFATPSMRNVAVTGPYMHDGRFATLEE
ncbi:MAG: MbnP family protein, partial [Verrucomicrobiales bacterium]